MPAPKLPANLDRKFLTGKFIYPLADDTPTIASGYPLRNDGKTPHTGLDLAIPVGTTLYAPATGEVVRSDGSDAKGYGNQLRVWHEALGVTSVMGHCHELIAAVGQVVAQGQPVAISGGAKGAPGAGSSQGPHCHFEVQVGRSPRGGAKSTPVAQTLDPRDLIKKFRYAPPKTT